MLRSVCVFCGSNPGINGHYAAAAARLGEVCARQERTLVYGGSKVGLMGIMADRALAGGGNVVGVTTEFLVDKEVAHEGLPRQNVTPDMASRKAMMTDLADGFIAMPGGIGTMEEIFEIWSHGQLGEHQKPYALLNIDGYYDALLSFLDHMADQGFVKKEHRAQLIVDDDPERLLARMDEYRPGAVSKWVDR